MYIYVYTFINTYIHKTTSTHTQHDFLTEARTTITQGADDLRRIRDIDLDAEAEAAQQAALEAASRAEEEEYAEDMEALQEAMGQPLPSARGCVPVLVCGERRCSVGYSRECVLGVAFAWWAMYCGVFLCVVVCRGVFWCVVVCRVYTYTLKWLVLQGPCGGGASHTSPPRP